MNLPNFKGKIGGDFESYDFLVFFVFVLFCFVSFFK